MKTEFKLIETLSYSSTIDLIFNAKEHLYISLPGMDQEIASALVERDKISKNQYRYRQF